jgi:hypothetical protein
VVLDRPTRKRCEFLVLRKDRKDGSGAYEQVFFRTETAIRAHRSRGRVELSAGAELDVAIDLRERYPWRFPGARVVRRACPGDYMAPSRRDAAGRGRAQDLAEPVLRLRQCAPSTRPRGAREPAARGAW